MEFEATDNVAARRRCDEHVASLLKLLLIWVQHKDGALVTQVNQLIQVRWTGDTGQPAYTGEVDRYCRSTTLYR